MNIEFTVRLPVEAESLPLVRGLVRQALQHLGMAPSGIEEVLLALSEACANVVQHAGEHEEYQVDVAITDSVCRISVLDHGEGFDAEAVAAEPPPPALEGGRGLLLMSALVDRLDFVNAEDGRHGVVLEKQLVAEPDLKLFSRN